jgi:ADP-ribose pyrophosphatase YjhB (NUDIX family)
MDYRHKRISSYADCRALHPQKTADVASSQDRWRLVVNTPDGSAFTAPPGSDVFLNGFAGTVELVVALSDDGTPMYDKVVYQQHPGVMIVAWGRDAEGVVRIAYLTQVRPFAIDPDSSEPGAPVFGQIPGGFLEPGTAGNLQTRIEHAVRRELAEETGVTRVLSIELPEPLTYWPDPTFMSNGTYVAFAEIELHSTPGHADAASDGEDIRRVEFITIPDLLARIAQGRTPDGAIHHMGLSLGPLMMFFARHPELFAGG